MKREIQACIQRYKELAPIADTIENAFHLLCTCFENGGKLLLCGNGGSAADCEHITGELLKEFKIKRKLPESFQASLKKNGADSYFTENIYGSLPAISLVSQTGFITAFNNDADPDFVYAQQVYGFGNKDDVLLAISTSGNSKNIVNASIVAKTKSLKVLALTGESGGLLKNYADVLIPVPSNQTDHIQEYHLPVYHTLCEMLENHFFL